MVSNTEYKLENGSSSADGNPITLEQALANLKQKEDLGLRYYAAWWLGKMRVREAEAIDSLLEALEDEADRTPDGGYPLRRNAAKALGKLGDRRIVPALIKCLECSDYYVRESAAEALEMLGDPICVPNLLQLLDGGIEAAVLVSGKPHLVQPYEAIIEALGTLGAAEAIARIEPFLEHFVEKVRYAAARSMYQLTRNSVYGDILVRALNGEDLQLRRSALMDLGAVGYLPAAEAIAKTLAENSMKIISLKGLLHKELSEATAEIALSQESIKILKLMDSLL
jgi:phycocyanobilin lyase alpha subunit